MRQKFIVGNWKMYTTAAVASRLAKAVADGVGIGGPRIRRRLSALPLSGPCRGDSQGQPRRARGAEPLSRKEGAFTGEVSPTMLLDVGCKYVILGHSERRHKLGESDAFINQKVRVALAAGLNVIFCVGETLEQRKANQTEAVLDRQLIQGLADVSADTLTRLIIAYEPIWAIGSLGHHATPQQAQEAHAVIRRRFGQIFGEKSAQACHTVRRQRQAGQRRRTLGRPGVDGALVGGAACMPSSFWPSSGLESVTRTLKSNDGTNTC